MDTRKFEEMELAELEELADVEEINFKLSTGLSVAS